MRESNYPSETGVRGNPGRGGLVSSTLEGSLALGLEGSPVSSAALLGTEQDKLRTSYVRHTPYVIRDTRETEPNQLRTSLCTHRSQDKPTIELVSRPPVPGLRPPDERSSELRLRVLHIIEEVAAPRETIGLT